MKPITKALAVTGALLGLLPAAALAQSGTTISGRVTTEANTPLPGVSVSVNALRSGAQTDANGAYSFTIPVDRAAPGTSVSITARRIGYAPKTVTVVLRSGSMTQDFQLSPAATELEGVVVTALGIEKEKKALGVAQQTIDSTMLTDGARTSNLVSDLSGKIAGINVTSATTTGGSARIVIRGATSIGGNNQPLFVVDGIPIDNSSFVTSTLQRGYGGYDLGNSAQDLNPDDIASISVLKGPNAAALYGARAANGAIIVTTKSGRGSRGFSVSASSNMTFETPLRLPKYQNSWGQGYFGDVCSVWKSGGTHFSEGKAPAGFDYATCGFSYVDGNYGGENDGVDESWGPRLDGTPRSQFSFTTPGAAEVRPWVAHPDNVSSFFQTGRTMTTNASAQGANDRANYRLGFTRQDVGGITPNNALNRTTATLTAGADITSKLSTNGNISYINNQGFNRPGTGYDEANPMMGFVWFGRQVDIAQLKSHVADPDGNQISWNYSYHNNPWWTQSKNSNHDQRDRVMGVASATYKFNEWLNATVRTGTDFYRNFSDYQFAAGWIGGGFDGGSYANGGFNETTRFVQETNSDFLITAQRNLLSDLGLNVNFGGNRRVNRYRASQFGTDALVIPGVYNIGNSAKTVTPSELTQEKRINSLYGQAEFSYRDYMFVNVTGRNDWSSTLPQANNSYFYPSISASYVFTQAIPSLTFGGHLNYGKLRGGWSRVGNDADPYQLAVTYNAGVQFGSISRFSVPNGLLNPTLKPENTDAWEVGTEMQWFDNRAGLDLTYYQKKTSNQILTASVSGASGFASALVNAGIISNRGVEAQLSFSPIRPMNPNGFGWDMTLNYGKNKNNVDELYGNLQTVALGPTHWSLSVEARKGYPYGAMFGVGYLRCGNYSLANAHTGADSTRFTALAAATAKCPTDGSANGKMLLSGGIPLGEPSSAKRVLGVYTPDWTGGWNNTFHYRGVDFGFLLDTRRGGNVYSTGNMWGSYAGILANTEFRPDTGIVISGIDKATGATNTVHVRTEDYYHSLYPIQEAWIYDASFVKLREARVGFNLPQSWLRNTTVKQARLSIVGRNLYLWANVPNIDPETAFTATNEQGIEMGQLPSTRSIGFQLSVTP
jgi:TonB-linked SusC/RagA family outer membrane protein